MKYLVSKRKIWLNGNKPNKKSTRGEKMIYDVTLKNSVKTKKWRKLITTQKKLW